MNINTMVSRCLSFDGCCSCAVWQCYALRFMDDSFAVFTNMVGGFLGIVWGLNRFALEPTEFLNLLMRLGTRRIEILTFLKERKL